MRGIKKAGGPIWPTALVSSGRRSCRLRSSSRWAQISRSRSRRWAQRIDGGATSSSFFAASSWEWSVPATCEPVGSLPAARNGCQPSSDDDVGLATDDVGGVRRAVRAPRALSRYAIREHQASRRASRHVALMLSTDISDGATRRAQALARIERRRTIGRIGLVALYWRRSTTWKPAFSNIAERAVIGVRGRDPAVAGVDRIRLEGRRALLARIGHRGVEQRRGHAAAARAPGHHEAHDRPDRRVVDGRQDLRPGQPLVLLARPEADPARPPGRPGRRPGRAAGPSR